MARQSPQMGGFDSATSQNRPVFDITGALPRPDYICHMTPTGTCDLAIIGGGLSGGLIALAAQRARPAARILLIEARPALGGNHLWSFVESDIGKADRPLLEPLITFGWRSYSVLFPDYQREIPDGLYSIRSDRFDTALRAILPAESILSGRAATSVTATSVELEGGLHIAAGGVIDARGVADLGLLDTAWRKFVGYELQLAGPHSVRRARLIEIAEGETDGLGFQTMLPLESDKLFVEDVRYEIDPALDLGDYARRIFNLAAKFGWRITDSARGQAGSIPIVMGGDFEGYWQSGGAGVAKAGLRAGLFHPVTGASLGDAVSVARLVASLGDWSGAALHKALHDHAAKRWARRDFYRRFARRMMRDTAPGERYRLFAALYMRDADVIGRFHGMRLSLVDRLALSTGDGPMPLSSLLPGGGG